MDRSVKVLIFCRYYLPGVRAGGPIVAISNLVELLGDDVEFELVTDNKDLGAKTPYEEIVSNQWSILGKAKVFYCDFRSRCINQFFKIIRESKPQVVYLNSLFDIKYTLLPALLSKFIFFNTHVVIAPRGELNPGALALKRKRKRAYLSFFNLWTKILGLSFQATNEEELSHIEKWFPGAEVKILNDFSVCEPQLDMVEKDEGELRCVIVSRISPMKNIDYLLDILIKLGESSKNKFHISLDIYGFVEDVEFWQTCLDKIAVLPDYILVEFKGGLPQAIVSSTIAGYHLFFLPTRGENFGYSIAEALAASVPVLISDRTPWQDLEQNRAGNTIPLEDPYGYVEVLNSYIWMDEFSYQKKRTDVSKYYQSHIDSLMKEIRHDARSLFGDVLTKKI